MLIQAIYDHLNNYFDPIPSIVPASVTRCIDHAVDYYNSECSETKCVELTPTINNNTRSGVIDMSEYHAISVVDVIPRMQNMISEVGSVDNLTDLILLNWTDKMITGGGGQYRDMQQLVVTRQFLAQYKQYFGLRFDWRFFTEIQKLTFNQLPYTAATIFIVYKALIPTPVQLTYDIKDVFAYRWIKDYSLALFQMRQGEILAKATSVGLDVQGSSIKSEGMDRKKQLEDEIAKITPLPIIR